MKFSLYSELQSRPAAQPARNTEVSITVNAGGAEHWKAIKTQELFAHAVMPHFRAFEREAAGIRT